MEQTGHPWLAAMLDVAMRPLFPARRLVVPEATGTVLEVGVGTGLNFGLYGGIEALVGVDPDPHMLARARPRAAALPAVARSVWSFPTRSASSGVVVS
jgi:SAM-dependent methyltransferase